jgi:hypothetical protein
MSIVFVGLREVEINQNRWLNENALMARDLDAALAENQMLSNRIDQLNAILVSSGLSNIEEALDETF